MIYQVRATMFFEKEDEALDFYHDCQTAMPKATVVNPNSPDQECSNTDYALCYHDENPHEPCEIQGFENNCPEPL